MPHSRFTLRETAAYLHLREEQVLQLFRANELPGQHQGDQLIFLKSEVHDWATRRLLGDIDEVEDFHEKVSAEQEASPDPEQPLLSRYARLACIDPCLDVRTKSKVLRELVTLASRSHLICDDAEYLSLVEEREGLCSTAVDNGVAIPHSRIHDEYLVFDSFLVIARLPNGVNFGAPDGGKTDLFFMPCAHNERVHLHLIARLAWLLHTTPLAEGLRACDSAEEMLDTLRRVEQSCSARAATA
jgi:mannitol/fructose-specific phosphotransferase system IIA component (Ntr-type)